MVTSKSAKDKAALIAARGVDEHGYVVNPCSVVFIAEEFETVIDGATEQLLLLFPQRIHSVYLYGSIARGDAVVGCSDLDMSIILHDAPSRDELAELHGLADQIALHHTEISKVDFDIGTLADVLAKESFYSWQFWIKHCCCCIWGDDLAPRFAKLRPSSQLGYAINADLPEQLSTYRKELTTENAPLFGRAITKRLIRTLYGILADYHQRWQQPISQCGSMVALFRPEYAAHLRRAWPMLQYGALVDVDEVVWLIDDFGAKVCEELQRVSTVQDR
ncbi:nucleotidyltransferase domain-containing protein [Celerinatantimonas yamalensis]|uniref:Nucleotidyltransferase domain-containing protein n=1 Tax=Celerinatantimonas yamalensis TaxID=559956 RepID=A0ABW9G2S0_9GAMM